MGFQQVSLKGIPKGVHKYVHVVGGDRRRSRAFTRSISFYSGKKSPTGYTRDVALLYNVIL